jgi:hypothetical protein
MTFFPDPGVDSDAMRGLDLAAGHADDVPAGFAGAPRNGFHRAAVTTSQHGVAGCGNQLAKLIGFEISRCSGCGPCAAKDSNVHKGRVQKEENSD